MFSSLLYGQKYGYQWTHSFGNTSSDVGNHIAVDQNGNIYSTGNFLYTVDFDPGLGVFNLNAIANEDAFILKLDSNGNFAWAKKIGWTSTDDGLCIHADAAGSVIAIGEFRGTVDLDPGPATASFTSTGFTPDNYIVKLDNNGNTLWVKRLGSNNGIDSRSIVSDQNQNIYITGSFGGTIDFDPGPNTHNINKCRIFVE